ncbi:Proteasome activator subunit 4 [Babesia sp. Xinjiang]|uniref:Proteasome activator subunit 4 n=1 Tax=Babesia sp. Xinjiang TaxID=462227 RepID=UPI000A2158AB|nr:Proteasome activator subunit 4 [Babesia sp. Xinjiang]ORM39978.1 Proteasome activator subunit 4 [Babesia sp. Xinjiang]
MGVHQGVLFRVSAEIDNALPAFVKNVRDTEYNEVFELIKTSWESSDWVGLFSHGDQLCHYALNEKYLLDTSNLDRLMTLCRRLWLLAAHEVFTEDYSQNVTLYTQELVEDLKHVVKSHDKITLQNRIRSLQILISVLQALRQTLPSVWEVNSYASHKALDNRLNFITMDMLVQLFNKYMVESPVGMSSHRRKSWMGTLVRLTALMRHIWVFREDIGLTLVKRVLGDVSDIDLRNNDIFFKFRLILIMCPNAALYRLMVDGEIFKWWNLVNEGTVNFWNAMMLCFLVRAAKFGWATGKTYIVENITVRLPYLFHLIYSTFGIPNIVTVSRCKESVPGEFTVLLEKPLQICKKFGKLLAYLLCPIGNETDAGATFASDIMDYLTAVVSAVYPYTHPSNGGKWSYNIALFVRQFVLSYTRRVCRERASPNVVCSKTGSTESGVNLRLNRANDDAIVELFYPLALQGMYSKNMHVAYAYEDVIKRLCYLLPDKTLVGLLDHLILSSESVTEPHQMLCALRLFAQLIPLILTYSPQALIPILEIALKGIDSSDPFKTGQTLTLVNVIFSHLACRDLSDIELSHQDKVELIRSMYMSGEGETGDVETSLDQLALDNNLVDVRSAMLHISGEMVMPDNPEDTYSRDMVVLKTAKKLDDAVTALDALLNQRRYITQTFSCWCLDWFRAMLQLAENSSKPNSGTDSLMNAVDMGTFILTRSALVTILSQTDDYTFRTICETFVQWVCDNAFRQDALKYMVAIATSLSYANGSITMDLVFAKLFAKFKRGVENSSDGLSETQIVWFISCFSGLVRRAKIDLVSRLPSLRYIFKVGLGHKSKSAFKSTAKLLQRCIDSLTGVYFTDLHCSNNFKDDLNPGLLLWDLPWFARDAQFRNGKCDISVISGVEWHIASKQEIDCAMELCWYSMQMITNLTKDLIDISYPVKPEGATDLDVEIDLTQTLYVRTNRACSLAKSMLRGLKNFIVDDRDISATGLPKVTPIECTETHRLQQFVLDFILSVLSKYGGIDSINDLMVTKLFAKLLKVADEYLCRHAILRDNNSILDSGSLVGSMKQESHVGTTITAGRSMLPWMSFYHGIHSKGFWQDAPRATWLLMLHERYNERLNLRKLGHYCEGPRRQLLNMVLQCAICQYKDVSGYAQQLIKPLTSVHRKLRSDVCDYLLERGMEIYPKSADGSSSVLECLSCIPDILSIPLVKHIVNKPYLFSKFCKFIFGVVLTTPNKDSLMSKYDNLLLSLINCREQLSPTAATTETMNSTLDSVFDDGLKQVQAATHWRFQLYATSLLVTFRHLIPRESFGRYISWLIEVSNHTTKHPCVVTVALSGLYRLLSDSVVSTDLPSELWSPNFANILLNSICAVNHDSIKQDNSSTVKQSNAIVTSVIKLERSWPRNRVSSNSKAFSMQNFLVAYHYFCRVFDGGYMEVVERAVSVLDEIASSPPTVSENHCAFAEISAGLMKASLRAPSPLREHFWRIFHPVFKRELDALVPDRIVDFMDGLRLAIDGSDFSCEGCIPIFNLAINFGAPLSMTALHSCDLINGNNTSLGVVKQLKLYQAVLQQVTTLNHHLFDKLCDGILNESTIFNDSLQVVDEVGYLCSFLVSLCCTYNELGGFKDRVHNCISKLIASVEGKDYQDDTAELSIKGLLSVIGLLYSMSLPAQDLGHQYTSQYLEFCLRFSASSNPTISDVATRAVHNIAMSPYHSRNNLTTVEAIVRTLETTCKAQLNKTKANSIQVATMLQRNLCMYLRNTGVVKMLLEMYIAALNDRQVRDNARSALTSITISARDQVHLELTERFYALTKDKNGDLANAGVLGLAALVATSPYHVPKWLPHTLTTLVSFQMFYTISTILQASCGASRFPDTVRVGDVDIEF